MRSRSIRPSRRTKAPKESRRVLANWRAGISTLVALVALLTVIRSYPQQTNGQQSAPRQLPPLHAIKMTRAPLSHIYMNFLFLQNRLDREATARDMQGKNGNTLRYHFQKQLGFSGSEFAIVRSAGLRLESDLKDINASIKMTVQADRAARLQTSNQPGLLASRDPMLQDLVKQREDAIRREVAQMNSELGPKDATKLRTYLESHLQNRALLHLRPVPHAQKQLSPQVRRQPEQP
jgi:hypothetical protein